MNCPELKRPKKSYRALSLIMLVVSTTITMFFAEVLFRTLLFSEFSFMQTLKRPEFYANEWDMDFFKLRHFFEQKYKEPPDKILGWIKSQINASKTYNHVDDVGINGRVPVLLYGDSFAACHTTPEDCFQGILNNSPDFNGTNYLINYGVSGYGFDQIYLLYQHTIQKYHNPIVIVGVMNYDLDRNIMPVTWGLKH